jgi:hypothetical protein
MSTYTILTRDAGGTQTGLIDQFISLDFAPRFNDVGIFNLTMDYATLGATLIERGHQIDVLRDNVTIFSGVVTGRKRVKNETENSVTYSGLDSNIFLRRRLALPVPGGPPYSSASHDTQTGKSETVMKHYVDYNIGASARTSPDDRRRLTVELDYGRGTDTTCKARFDNLLTLLQVLARRDGLGFRVLGGEFQVYVPSDKSGEIVFSDDLGTLSGYEYEENDPDGNYAIVGGGGEGTLRSFVETADSTSVAADGLSEFFIDRRDTIDTAVMLQEAVDQLNDKAGKSAYKLKPLEAANMRVFDDYWLGDQVAADIDGVTIIDVVREVKFTIAAGVETIEPTIGSQILGNVFSKLKRDNQTVSNRVNRLELV